MRFISTIVMTQVATKNIKEKINEDKLELIQSINEDEKIITSDHIDKDTYKFIYDCYNLYSKIENDDNIELKLDFPLWLNITEKSLLRTITLDKSAYTIKVLFHAQTLYLIKEKFNKERFQEWMRVIRNIASYGNTYKNNGKRDIFTRTPEVFRGVILLINELSQGCSDIYTYLANNKVKSQYAKEQVDREVLKSKIFISKPEYKELIWEIEDINLLRGNVSFPFYCIGYNGNDISNIDTDLLTKIKDILLASFNEEDVFSNDFRRAMFTIEINNEYNFYTYWDSYWYIGSATKYRMFNNYRELEWFMNNKDYKEYFKKLVLLLTGKKFEDIINDFNIPDIMPKWQGKIIKKPKLINERKSNYIAITSDNKTCYLLKNSKPREIEGSIKIK